jgi:hypothetical protein
MDNKSLIRKTQNKLLNKAKKMLEQHKKMNDLLGHETAHYQSFIKWYNELFEGHNKDMEAFK